MSDRTKENDTSRSKSRKESLLWEGAIALKYQGRKKRKEGNSTSVLTGLIDELSHWAGHLPLQIGVTEGHSHQC